LLKYNIASAQQRVYFIGAEIGLESSPLFGSFILDG